MHKTCVCWVSEECPANDFIFKVIKNLFYSDWGWKSLGNFAEALVLIKGSLVSLHPNTPDSLPLFWMFIPWIHCCIWEFSVPAFFMLCSGAVGFAAYWGHCPGPQHSSTIKMNSDQSATFVSPDEHALDLWLPSCYSVNFHFCFPLSCSNSTNKSW